MTEKEKSSMQNNALDISHSCCVKASAGTGKTFVLTKRYVTILKSGIDLNKILCLTFTDKAAAEMREKIEREIRKTVREYDEASAAGEKTEITKDEYQHLKSALSEIHRCTISTFHSFCSSILKEYPLESGVPIGYSIMTGIDVQDLVTNTITETLEHPDERIRPYVVTLYRFTSSTSEIVRTISTMLSKRSVCTEWFDNVKNHPEKIIDGWKHLQETAILKLAEAFKQDTDIQKLFEFIDKNAVSDSYKNLLKQYTVLQEADTPEKTAQEIDRLFNMKYRANTISVPENLLHTYKEMYKKEYEQLHTFSQYPFSMEDARTRFMLSIMRAYIEVTDEIAGKIASKKNAGSYLNFDDLLEYTRDMLNNPVLCHAISDHYSHVLVDEVQDNDPALTEIVNKLTKELNEKKLFIVGDMKQSIYRFKGADPNKVKNELFSRFGKENEIEQNTNYRTVLPLVSIVNSIFKKLYPKNNRDGIEYTEVMANREDRAGTITILTHSKSGKASTSTDEAELLASWICSKIEDPSFEIKDETTDCRTGREIGWRRLKYSDIAILVRKNKDADPIKNVFSRYGIRCSIYNGKNFYNEQEIYDFVSVIKASLFHEDDSALYGALKSPYFGITDEELAFASYSQDYHPPNLWTRLTRFTKQHDGEGEDTEFSRAAKEKISSALTLLKRFNTCARTKPLTQFLNDIIRATGILTVYAAHPSGPDKIRDLKRFLAAAESSSTSRSASAYDFIRMIETCIEDRIDDDAGSTDGEDDTDDAVQILSYHVSKGLEYPVVVLFKTGDTQDDHLNKGVLTDEEYGAGLATLKYPGEEKNLFEFLKTLITYKVHPENVAEEKRLFYVGMTRARDHLALTCSEASKTGNVGKDSYMEMYRSASEGINAEMLKSGDLPTLNETEVTLTIPEMWGVVQEEETADAVTSKPEEKEEETSAEAKQWAMSRGTCMHAIFEGRDPEEMCRKYGFEKEIDTFIAAREEFYASDLMQNCKRIMPELSVFTSRNENNAPERKRADLLVQYEDDTYRLFDFKSGSLKSNEKFLSDYVVQLKKYASLLGDIFHAEIPAYLCFPEEEKGNRFREVPTD